MQINYYGDKHLVEKYQNQINLNIVDNNESIVIVFGGDGTLLRAIKQFGLDYLYLPINCGSLGFLTSYEQDDLPLNIDDIEVCEFDVLQTEINNELKLIVNEIKLETKFATDKFRVMSSDLVLDYFSCGMSINTPLGSTGCARALGAPIINPKEDLITIIPIMPLNNKVYSTLVNPVVTRNKEIKISSQIINRVTIDGIEYPTNNTELIIKPAPLKLKLINSKLASKYYQQLQDKLL